MRRRFAALLCVMIAVPLPAVAQPPGPPGARPKDGVEYVVEPIGKPPHEAFALRCRNGTMDCAYDFATLCDGNPAINPDATARWTGTAHYTTHGGQSIRVFVCTAVPRPPAGTALMLLMLATSFQACTDLHPHLRSDLEQAYRRVQEANASLTWPPITARAAPTITAEMRAQFDEATCRRMTVEPPPVIPAARP